MEGKNLVIEFRYAKGKFDRLPALATELVRLNVDVIVTAGPSVTRPAKEATAVIPIVMTNDSDPVGSGFVASLARPGGNVTGLSSLARELSGKRLELLKEILPNLSRVAILGTFDIPGNAQATKETEQAAASFRVPTQYFDIRGSKDIEAAFLTANKWRADAGVVLNGPPHIQRLIPAAAAKGRLIMPSPNPLFFGERKRIAELARKYRFPAIYPQSEYVDEGGLMSYGADYEDLYRRAAVYVDKISRGAKPADLPVQQATKFKFIVNLKAAKQISLTIPVRVLERADKVIK